MSDSPADPHDPIVQDPPFRDDQTFHDDVEAYCGKLSYAPGEVVQLHVSSRVATYDVTVERWGATRTEVWSAAEIAGTFVPPPVEADSAGCNWPVALEIPVDRSWESGFYLVTLRGNDSEPGRDQSHACFVVRAGKTRQRALYVLPANTWNAYNTWGGKSLYTGGHTVSFQRPFARGMLARPLVDRDDRKARPVRWGEEPDADGNIFQQYRTSNNYPSAIGSTGWFTHARRFVEWAEGAGYRFDYAVSSDLETDPGVAADYDLIVSIGHDEYWSAGQRSTVEAHIAGGGHFASFSGNTMFWQVRLEDGDRHMTCYKYTAHTDDPVVAAGKPTEATGMWGDPSVGQPEWSLLGAGSAYGLYHRFGNATARGVGGFLVYRADHWMLANTGLGYGDVLGAKHGAVGYETLGCPITFDEFQLPVPAYIFNLADGVEIVGMVPSSNLGVGDYPASIAALSDQGDLEFIAQRIHGSTSDQAKAKVRHGNALMLTCRPFARGGEVVTVGTTDWVFGLADDQPVDQVTRNVLDRFLG